MASRSAAQPTTNLDATAWIEAAFDALADGGIEAVRVDPLAKRLGVTRGSFYWHFTDRAALHQAMLKPVARTRRAIRSSIAIERNAETGRRTAEADSWRCPIPANARACARRSSWRSDYGRGATSRQQRRCATSTACAWTISPGSCASTGCAPKTHANARSSSTRR